MAVRTLVTVETIFCDFEFDFGIRKTFLRRWMAALRGLAKITVPPATEVHFFLYLSRDKTYEREALEAFLNSLDDSPNRKFHLIEYSHPPTGYGVDESAHPDLYKSPNKASPNRNVLYRRAIAGITLKNFDRLVRATLDDDDFWLPWQVIEILRAAEQVYDPDKIVGVGLRQAAVAYIPQKMVDVVEFSHHMNGNKFYVSPKSQFDKQVDLSPWSIPEQFNALNQRKMSRIGVGLRSLATNVPGWIYGRWGGNLSLHSKSRYYRRINSRFELEAEEELMPRIISDIATNFTRMSKMDQLEADYAQHESEEFIFKIPPESLPSGAVAVAIFKFSDGGPDVKLRIQPKKIYRSRDFPQLNRLNHGTVGFIQARYGDGSRTEVSERGRLVGLKYLDPQLIENLQKFSDTLDQSTKANIELGLRMSTWIVPYDSGRSPANNWENFTATVENIEQLLSL